MAYNWVCRTCGLSNSTSWEHFCTSFAWVHTDSFYMLVVLLTRIFTTLTGASQWLLFDYGAWPSFSGAPWSSYNLAALLTCTCLPYRHNSFLVLTGSEQSTQGCTQCVMTPGIQTLALHLQGKQPFPKGTALPIFREERKICNSCSIMASHIIGGQ